MNVVVVNAGSSTLKFGLFRGEQQFASASIRLTGASHDDLIMRIEDRRSRTVLATADRPRLVAEAIRCLLSEVTFPSIDAVGHRIVHGGAEFTDSVLLTPQAKDKLASVAWLAPLHNPPALDAIAGAEQALPEVPHVGVFDTAFYATLPAAAIVYPIPYEWFTQSGVRRFGFHGISHSYCSRRASELLGRRFPSARLVVCHLGNGCSVTAVRGGCPIATSMGFTPMEGLMMGSRSGSIDPGVLIHMQRAHGLTVDQLDLALNRQSGLLGVSGVSSDYREVEVAADEGNDRAQLALEMFADRVRATIGSLAVGMGGLDALVFTGGIGEHAVRARAAICDRLPCVGLTIDLAANLTATADIDIATTNSLARIFVIHTREEWMIAQEAARVAIT